MMMKRKLALALLAGALALPAAGLASPSPQAVQPAPEARQKPKIDAPADCKVTGNQKGSAAMEKRKKAHADRKIVTGEAKVKVHNLEAAHEHGKHQ